MASHANRHPTLMAVSAVVVGLCASDCGTFAPPIDHASAPAPSRAERAESSAPLTIEPVEGRPGALVLRLATSFRPSSEGRLEVRRRIGGGPSETIRTVELSERLVTQLTEGGVEFIDRAVEADRTHHYRLLFFESADQSTPAERSSPVELAWRETPPRPSQIHARADTARAVELRWKPSEYGALVFRRNVLAESSETRRIADVGKGAGGALVDRDVEPGAVYTYRVALSVEHDGFTQYGPPSEELYVSVPQQ